jgi:beta-mannosidase
MISCEEEGLLTQSMNVNEEPFEVQKSIRINVSNESMCTKNGTVKWQLRNSTGTVLREESEDISVAAQSVKWFETVKLPEAKLYEDYVSYQLMEDGEVISQGTVLFCPPKHFKFTDPELTVRTEGDEIIVKAEHFAKSIEMRNENDDLILSDNFFDLNGGERRVKIIKGEPVNLEVRSVYSIR